MTPHGPARYAATPRAFADDAARRTSKASSLDAADLRIIDSLIANGRANARSMTASTGLSEETVADRMRALLDRRIIGISAIVDWRAAGYSWDLFLFVNVGSVAARSVVDELAAQDQVVSIYEVFGPVDIVAHVLCHDREDMLEFVSTTVRRFDGVGDVDVMLSLDTVKYFHEFARVPVTTPPPELPDPIIELTPVDHGIIASLMRNGRAPHREIARGLGVSDGTVRARLRRLVSAGLVRVAAQVDPTNSGMIGAQAFVGITVRGSDRAAVATKLAPMGPVLTVTVTTGRFDLFCYVVARTRAELVEHVVSEIRAVDGVGAVETWEMTAVRKHVGRWARW